MKPTIRVVVALPGQRAQGKVIDNNLHALQALVGGYIEAVAAPDALRDKGFTVYCNEDGKALALSHNLSIGGGDFIGGPIVVSMSDDSGEEIGLDEKQAMVAARFLDFLRGLYEVPA